LVRPLALSVVAQTLHLTLQIKEFRHTRPPGVEQ
jgi:hypothetical protein